jgi:hypothetical protein
MNFVTRGQWGARPPTSGYQGIHSQVTTGHWEGPHMGDFPHDSCATKVRGIQAYHMDNNGWSDIAYNGMACPHGAVFEGRGPNHRSAANGTNEGNDSSAVICYLGGEGDPLTDLGKQAMTDGAEWLGQPMRKGHKDWYNTACPGDEIYNWIHDGTPPPNPPKPKELEEMTPEILVAADGRTWYFITGVDNQVWVKIYKGPAVVADWYTLGGHMTSGLSAVEYDDTKIQVGGRGDDGALWTKTSRENGDFGECKWENAGGEIKGAPVG